MPEQKHGTILSCTIGQSVEPGHPDLTSLAQRSSARVTAAPYAELVGCAVSFVYAHRAAAVRFFPTDPSASLTPKRAPMRVSIARELHPQPIRTSRSTVRRSVLRRQLPETAVRSVSERLQVPPGAPWR